jgi:hypothetical protein
VQKKWSKYGLPFEVPTIDAFEPDIRS